MTSLEVIPGILEKSWEEIEKKLKLTQEFASTVHIDIIDGKFVNNTTLLDPAHFAQYSQNTLLELHMMVENPIKYIRPFAEVGFKRFLGHIEKMPDQNAFIKEAKKYGEVGLALDGPTSTDNINVLLDNLDCLLIYTSDKVGFSGPSLVEDRLNKVSSIRRNSQIPIEVDGGINSDTIKEARDKGATRFAATSAIFNDNPKKSYQHLSQLLNEQ